MAITMQQIKELREKTGAGVSSVKEALENSKGDFEKAILYLREKGLAKGLKRSDKTADKGFIAHYIHGEGTIASLLELNSETDFASRNDKFRNVAHDLAVHVVAMTPEYINIENIPNELIAKEKAIAMKTIDPKKPQQVIDRIIEGKLQKFYGEVVLMEQAFFKDDSVKIKDMVNELVAAIGEKITIGRFCRVEVGKPSIIAESV